MLNFGRPTRQAADVRGRRASTPSTFVRRLGFKELDATGTFDGVLPMIFDENGGRIVGGRLDARPGGGSLAYNGVVNKADLGTMGNIAFNALQRPALQVDDHPPRRRPCRRIRERGSTIDGVGLGPDHGDAEDHPQPARARSRCKLNVTITGPFRALIATAKSFSDPRQVIGDVLPRPLDDVPGITTEVRRVEEQAAADPDPGRPSRSTPPPPTPPTK